MQLPTQAQVNTATRYAVVVAGTIFTMLGLQTKGITLDQVKALIEALGSTINSVLMFVTAVGTLYAAYVGVKSASPTGQAASIGANPSTIVNAAPGGKATVTINDPAMASAALTAQKNAA